MASTGVLRLVLRGAAAGAAGTTALNVVTYLDMVVRARPASSTPTRTVEQVAGRLGLSIPGDEDERSNRVAALGAVSGLLTGVVAGAGLGAVRAAGFRRGPSVTGLATAGGAMAAANGPMVVLGITDPRDWSAADWVADLVPHLAYGLVTAWVLHGLDARSMWTARRIGYPGRKQT